MLGVLYARSTSTEACCMEGPRPPPTSPSTVAEKARDRAEAWAGGPPPAAAAELEPGPQPSATPATRPGAVANELMNPRRRRILDSTAACGWRQCG